MIILLKIMFLIRLITFSREQWVKQWHPCVFTDIDFTCDVLVWFTDTQLVMVTALWSLATLEVVTMTTSSVASDHKVGIISILVMTKLVSFQFKFLVVYNVCHITNVIRKSRNYIFGEWEHFTWVNKKIENLVYFLLWIWHMTDSNLNINIVLKTLGLKN